MNQDNDRMRAMLGLPVPKQALANFTQYGKISKPAPEMMRKTPAEIAAEQAKTSTELLDELKQAARAPKPNRKQRRAQAKKARLQEKAQAKRENREMGVLYACDPTKNVKCNRKSCFLNGGPCRATKHLEFAKQPLEKVRLVFPMSEKEAKELGVE